MPKRVDYGFEKKQREQQKQKKKQKKQQEKVERREEKRPRDGAGPVGATRSPSDRG